MNLRIPTLPDILQGGCLPAMPRQCDPSHLHRTAVVHFSGLLATAAVLHAGIGCDEALAIGPSGLTPYQKGFQLEYGLQGDRIRKCEAGAQPNCVSTSSNSDLYSPPWLAYATTPSEAIKDFDSALRAISPEVDLIDSQETQEGGIYRRYRVPSAISEYDIIEVLAAKQRPPYESEPPMVTYRSQAGTTKYVWPITQPVSDMGAQRKRMGALRARLGWRILGGDCDVLECFQD